MLTLEFSGLKAVLTLEFSGLNSSFQGYDPSEGDGEVRDRFWNNMDRILDRVGK